MNNKLRASTGMNQFAQLLSAKKQIPVLLDCCTIVCAKNGERGALELRNRIANRRDIRIIVPGMLVKEIAKVAKISIDGALKVLEWFSEVGQIEYVETSQEITKRALDLTRKYPIYCHYPDSLYVIHCRQSKAVLITYDKNLRYVALAEGLGCSSTNSF